MGRGPTQQRLPLKKPRIAILPTTRLGRWAVGLGIAYFLLVLGWRLTGPLGAMPGFASGVAGGAIGLVAIFRRGERAVTVFAAIMPLVLVASFVLAELLIGHD